MRRLNKDVKISEEVHNRLSLLKIDLKFKSLDDTILYLIRLKKSKK